MVRQRLSLDQKRHNNSLPFLRYPMTSNGVTGLCCPEKPCFDYALHSCVRTQPERVMSTLRMTAVGHTRSPEAVA